jgi:hypothetical protein
MPCLPELPNRSFTCQVRTHSCVTTWPQRALLLHNLGPGRPSLGQGRMHPESQRPCRAQPAACCIAATAAVSAAAAAATAAANSNQARHLLLWAQPQGCCRVHWSYQGRQQVCCDSLCKLGCMTCDQHVDAVCNPVVPIRTAVQDQSRQHQHQRQLQPTHQPPTEVVQSSPLRTCNMPRAVFGSRREQLCMFTC